MAITFNELWALDYAPRLRERREREASHRTDAMTDKPIALCGEMVRQITADDIFTLDALGNPFIAGSADGFVEFVDCAGFLWEIAVENDHTNRFRNLWRRALLVRRLAALPLEEVARAIETYLARMRLDTGERKPDSDEPPPAEDPLQPEAKTHFLVPLLMEVTAEIGATDPRSGELLAFIPLPRLIQYQRAFAGHQQKATEEVQRMRVECNARVNEINWLERQQPNGSQ